MESDDDITIVSSTKPSLGKRKKKYLKLSEVKGVSIKQFVPIPILDVTSDIFHRCTKCPHSYLKEASLARHIARAHPEERESSDEAGPEEMSFSCPKCDFIADNKRAVYRHLKTKHGTPSAGCSKVYNCPYCLYKTVSGAHLRSHIAGYHIDETLFKQYECHSCQFKCNTNCDIYIHLASCCTKNSSGESSVAAGAANYSQAGPSGASSEKSPSSSQAGPSSASSEKSPSLSQAGPSSASSEKSPSLSQAGPSGLVEGSDSDIEVLGSQDPGESSERAESLESSKPPELSGISRTEDILSSLFDDDDDDDDDNEVDSCCILPPQTNVAESPDPENTLSNEDESTDPVPDETETIPEENDPATDRGEDTQTETETICWEQDGSVLISAVQTSSDAQETETIAQDDDQTSQEDDQSTAVPDDEVECIDVSDDEAPSSPVVTTELPTELPTEPALDTQAYMNHLFSKTSPARSAPTSPSRLKEAQPMDFQEATFQQQFQDIQQPIQQPAVQPQPSTFKVQQIFTNGSTFVVSTQPKEFMLKFGYPDPVLNKRPQAIIDHGDKDDSPDYQPNRGTGKAVYKCSDCPQQWGSQISLKKHLARSGHGKFGCHICSFRSTSVSGLKIHISHLHRDTAVRHFLCFICSKRFGSSALLNNHIQRGHYKKQPVKRLTVNKNMQTHRCPDCSMTFGSQVGLSGHLASAGHGQFVCSVCTFRSATAVGLNIHRSACISRKQGGTAEPVDGFSDNLLCTMCNFRARNDSGRSRHLKAKHPEIYGKRNSGECKTCGDSFDNLKMHTWRCKRRIGRNTMEQPNNGVHRQQTEQCSELGNDKVQMLKALSLWPIFQKKPCGKYTQAVNTNLPNYDYVQYHTSSTSHHTSKPSSPSVLIIPNPAAPPNLVIDYPTPSLPSSPSLPTPTITPTSPCSVALTNITPTPETTSDKIPSMDYLHDLTLPSIRHSLTLETDALISKPTVFVVGASERPAVSPVISPVISVLPPLQSLGDGMGVLKNFVTVPKTQNNVAMPRPPGRTATLASMIGVLHPIKLVTGVSNHSNVQLMNHVSNPPEPVMTPSHKKQISKGTKPTVGTKHKPNTQHQPDVTSRQDEPIVVTKYKGPSLHRIETDTEDTDSEDEGFSETKCVECDEVIPTSVSYADHIETCGKTTAPQPPPLESTPQLSPLKQSTSVKGSQPPVQKKSVPRKSTLFPTSFMKPKPKPTVSPQPSVVPAPSVIPQPTNPPQHSVDRQTQRQCVTATLPSVSPVIHSQPPKPSKPPQAQKPSHRPKPLQLTQPSKTARKAQPWPFLPKRPSPPSTPAVQLPPPPPIYYPPSAPQQQPQFLGPVAIGLSEEEVVETSSAPSPRPRNTSREQRLSDEDLDCPNCNYTAMSKTELGHHISSHSGISYQCNLCEYESSSKKRLLRHRQTSHDLQQ